MLPWGFWGVLQAAQNRLKNGSDCEPRNDASARNRLEIGSESARNRLKIGSKSAQNRLDSSKSARNRESAQNRLKIGSKSARNRLEIGSESARQRQSAEPILSRFRDDRRTVGILGSVVLGAGPATKRFERVGAWVENWLSLTSFFAVGPSSAALGKDLQGVS